MSKLQVKRGTTSKLVRLFAQDSSSTTGAGLTGLTNASAGLSAYYIREGDATVTAIALAVGTVGTWSSGGFKEIDATNMPGWYELGLPNAALASGNSSGILIKGATNLAPLPLELELLATDNQTAAVQLDLTQAVPTSNTSQTIGDTLNAARAQGFGKWTLVGTTLSLYAADGTTVVRSFTLDSGTAPTSRT